MNGPVFMDLTERMAFLKAVAVDQLDRLAVDDLELPVCRHTLTVLEQLGPKTRRMFDVFVADQARRRGWTVAPRFVLDLRTVAA